MSKISKSEGRLPSVTEDRGDPPARVRASDRPASADKPASIHAGRVPDAGDATGDQPDAVSSRAASLRQVNLNPIPDARDFIVRTGGGRCPRSSCAPKALCGQRSAYHARGTSPAAGVLSK
jgi:hypothetical protein